MAKNIKKLFLILALVLVIVYIWCQRFGEPQEFIDQAVEYKYGSIGADHPMAQAPIPYWLWKVLPEVYPPNKERIEGLNAGPWNGQADFAAFGLVTEPSVWPNVNSDGEVAITGLFERPIGFSKRRVYGMDFVGANCAFCHLSTYRAGPGAETKLVLAGTGNSVYIEQYFLYLFKVLKEAGREPKKVMEAVDAELSSQKQSLGWFQRFLYRYIILPVVLPAIVNSREEKYFDWIQDDKPTALKTFGPGRVDTWALYKRMFVDPKQTDVVNGIVDFPPFWNQRAREGMQMHWDGNIAVAEERNVISALSLIGKHISFLDFKRVEEVGQFANGLLPPRYEDEIPSYLPGLQRDLVDRGRDIWEDRCASCHQAGGDRLGRSEPIEGIGTDPERLRDFSVQLVEGLNRLKTKKWRLQHFEIRPGYLNNLLDGLWLRAPYLHNGSVPTLRDLLKHPDERPKVFCRGNDVYDWENVGYVSSLTSSGDRPCGNLFLYDTAMTYEHDGKVLGTGNGNGGHLYGTDLSETEKNELLEFLKTI